MTTKIFVAKKMCSKTLYITSILVTCFTKTASYMLVLMLIYEESSTNNSLAVQKDKVLNLSSPVILFSMFIYLPLLQGNLLIKSDDLQGFFQLR